ncbi:TrfB-related DNA-binding protein [Priestia megaterium]|uniref:TrfB-related DNA-binding protein n=1 Tax=Priestia megaterium TaxID=1404 RepID=UPI0023DB3748|nr:TrfB-related DNA-binding protein [Priestia megaterium]MDF2010227.1 TrfB-related DNA-binding protein [Priestia megaterium]
MGAVAIDVNANERKLEVMFPMDTKEGVETFLEHYTYLKELMYFSGDYDALIMVIDFEDAFDNCGLTVAERLIIQKVFIEDMKRVDIAKELGVTKQTVQNWSNRSIEKIAKYYKEVEESE